MKRACILLLVTLGVLVSGAMADTFGSGDNEFTIDFVNITGDASTANGTVMGPSGSSAVADPGFTDPGYDYRMGKYEITADQWDKFIALCGEPTGAKVNNLDPYDEHPTNTGSQPVNECSWYEMAQFVNYLNTSQSYQEAYKFTGTQGTSDYTWSAWDAADAAKDTMWLETSPDNWESVEVDNLYRHKDAHYFLPTETEWVKAAYWNDTTATMQLYATDDGVAPVAGVDNC
ncbi:MAG: SUMF1/EgtB/PvdO family nonheme iron enzyme, partial [Phycisphaerae bacterium]|nr:SUMF1/EgtB/PvdO family nonheme iron enzyme [Phycisphaerae bacterium]